MSSYTQADLTALKSMAAKGASKLRLANGEEITLRSQQEVLDMIQIMEREIAPQATVRKHFPTYSKGT